MEWLEAEVSFGLKRMGIAPSIPVEDFVAEDNYVVRAELPGIDPDKDVTVTLENDAKVRFPVKSAGTPAQAITIESGRSGIRTHGLNPAVEEPRPTKYPEGPRLRHPRIDGMGLGSTKPASRRFLWYVWSYRENFMT